MILNVATLPRQSRRKRKSLISAVMLGRHHATFVRCLVFKRNV